MRGTGSPPSLICSRFCEPLRTAAKPSEIETGSWPALRLKDVSVRKPLEGSVRCSATTISLPHNHIFPSRPASAGRLFLKENPGSLVMSTSGFCYGDARRASASRQERCPTPSGSMRYAPKRISLRPHSFQPILWPDPINRIHFR
jgi:hypothetical protein